ncbi:MAG: phosphodiester glycosidase family protein [Candidatus Latescibacterota bacterium]
MRGAARLDLAVSGGVHRWMGVARVHVLLLVAAGWSCQGAEEAHRAEELATGVYHHEVHLLQGPWSIHVLEIDLARAWPAGIRLQAVSPPDGALQRTSLLASGALAAVNGDFFGGDRSRITGVQVHQGVLLRPPRGRAAFAMTRDGTPLVATLRLRAGLITPGGAALPITAYSRPPDSTGLSLYGHHSRGLHDSVYAATGYQLQGLDGQRTPGDTVRAWVMQVRRRAWPLLLERGQWLVAAGERFPQADLVAAGDTVRLFVQLRPAEGDREVSAPFDEVIGGGPRILRDGEVSVEYSRERLSPGFAMGRHPRTAVGHSERGEVVFLVTVDGRQPGYSVGMSLEELAEFMRGSLGELAVTRLGAHQALNLDGGGSTTMVVRQQVVNRPSDQMGERPVVNALLVVRQ